MKHIGIADGVGATQEFLVNDQLFEIASERGNVQAQACIAGPQTQFQVLAGLGLEVRVGQQARIDARRRVNKTVELGRAGSTETTAVVAVETDLRVDTEQNTQFG